MKIFVRQCAFQKAYFFKMLICFGILFSLSASSYAIGVCTVNKLNTGSLIPVGFNPRQVIAGDLDDDGAPDMVVLSGSSSGSANTATVLLNDRRGSFTSFIRYGKQIYFNFVYPHYFPQSTINLVTFGDSASYLYEP